MKYFERSTLCCVATPVAQLLRWQMRRYLQPSATIGAVPKPKLSAPRIAALITSSPVFRPPSVCRRTLWRRSLMRSVWCVSASPSSHGVPAYLIERQRARARAAVVAGDRDEIRVRLRDAGRHRADARLGDELHRHERLRIHLLQVEDELRQVLDRIDVVMRRRRDEADAGPREAQPRDHLVDLVPGQLTALAGLRALRDLDLQHLGIDRGIPASRRSGPRPPA